MRFADPFHVTDGLSEQAQHEAERLMFLELTQGPSFLLDSFPFNPSLVCLWGNSTDLSLLINMTEDQIKSLQSTGGDHLAATEKNILGNDLNRLWDTVQAIRGKAGGRIDFVLDNAGFELYCDFVYGPSASFIHTSSLSRVSSFQLISSFRAVWRRRFVFTANAIPGLYPT
jgi:hypothetical protein